jgi:nicotinamidase-related amidase
MMETPALVLIDLQNDFLAAPRLEPHPDSIVAAAASLLQEFRRRGFPVAHIRTQTASDGSGRMPHWEEQGIYSCREGSLGYDAPGELQAAEAEPVFNKTRFSAFTIPDFEEHLRARKVNSLVLAGLYFQTCLRQRAAVMILSMVQSRSIISATAASVWWIHATFPMPGAGQVNHVLVISKRGNAT